MRNDTMILVLMTNTLNVMLIFTWRKFLFIISWNFSIFQMFFCPI